MTIGVSNKYHEAILNISFMILSRKGFLRFYSQIILKIRIGVGVYLLLLDVIEYYRFLIGKRSIHMKNMLPLLTNDSPVRIVFYRGHVIVISHFPSTSRLPRWRVAEERLRSGAPLDNLLMLRDTTVITATSVGSYGVSVP